MATNKYVVKRGDTWETIASKLGTSADGIARKNNAISKLTPGLILKLPGTMQPQVAKMGGTPPILPGATPTSAKKGVNEAGGRYRATADGGYEYKYNPETGRDNEKGKWLPTTAYTAWQKPRKCPAVTICESATNSPGTPRLKR